MIPRKIHFCWFSENPYPDSILNCIRSWRRFLPDYELVHWNYGRARAIGLPWIDKALAEKNWAFAADAVRLHAVYTEGGIYLDSDVEVVKSFDPLLKRKYFFGYENGSDRIEAAVFGAEPHFPPLEDALRFYREHSFEYSEDLVDEQVIPNVLKGAFQKWNLEIFSESFFSPKSFLDGSVHSDADTFCVHHFSSSWRPRALRKSIERRQWFFRHFPRPVAKILAAGVSLKANLALLGFRKTCRKIFKKF